MHHRQTARLGDLDIAYLQWGQPDAPPVLLLHGLADHARVWQCLGEALADRYWLVAPDMPGHGRSSKPQGGYSSPDMIAVLEALMDHLGWATAHVVSHSWTAKVTCIWATHHPQRLRSMVLVDPIFVYGLPGVLRVTFPLFYQLLPFLKGMGPFASQGEAVAQARTLKQYRDWTPWQQQVFMESIEPKSDGTWGSKFTVAARNGIFFFFLRVPGLTQPVAVPTLFVQPQRGVNRFDWQLRPYRRYLTNLEIQTVPSHHWAFLGAPVEFNQLVAGFLDASS